MIFLDVFLGLNAVFVLAGLAKAGTGRHG